MKTEQICYSIGSDSFDAYLAFPDGKSPSATVLVCHAWGGREGFAENQARRLAELGFVGAAIDVYGVGKRGQDKESCQELMMPLIENPSLLRERLQRAYEAVADHSGVDKSRMGVIGYCFGGACAILCARMGLDLKAAVSFHGLLKIGEKMDQKPKAPLLILHGQDDPMVPPSDVALFAEEMKRIDADWTFHAYPGVMHAFTNPEANDPDFGTVYHEATDQRSWKEMQAFLRQTLYPK